jgi:hypothetical protein
VDLFLWVGGMLGVSLDRSGVGLGGFGQMTPTHGPAGDAEGIRVAVAPNTALVVPIRVFAVELAPAHLDPAPRTDAMAPPLARPLRAGTYGVAVRLPTIPETTHGAANMRVRGPAVPFDPAAAPVPEAPPSAAASVFAPWASEAARDLGIDLDRLRRALPGDAVDAAGTLITHVATDGTWTHARAGAARVHAIRRVSFGGRDSIVVLVHTGSLAQIATGQRRSGNGWEVRQLTADLEVLTVRGFVLESGALARPSSLAAVHADLAPSATGLNVEVAFVGFAELDEPIAARTVRVRFDRSGKLDSIDFD